METQDINKLTVIIPFLNEGKEVYNTVRNLRDSTDIDFKSREFQLLFDVLLLGNLYFFSINTAETAHEFRPYRHRDMS